ncbi:hypothetical protein AVEN_253549-1 [Araneus ventricosus]|uniref:RNase H type-1 domain-containing protein n=1 Tax=Araneus ventricosus TaxID=182803 RepID=A0A4Y2BTG3_ARAVE|nr:hypothetical protein AVEN_253549-1 [Araneus ventricosus]
MSKWYSSSRPWFILAFSSFPDNEEGCHFTFYRLSAKSFPRKPFRKPLTQGLRREAFYDLPHRQPPITKGSCDDFLLRSYKEILLKSTNIKLGWIKAHVGYSGNEAADVLAKKATQEGIPTFIPAPRNHIKSLLQKESIIRWQKEWDNGETGWSVHNVLSKVKTTRTPWQRPEIMFVTDHGPFPTYLKRFNIRSSDSCGCGNLENPLHYATSCLFTTSYHRKNRQMQWCYVMLRSYDPPSVMGQSKISG